MRNEEKLESLKEENSLNKKEL